MTKWFALSTPQIVGSSNDMSRKKLTRPQDFVGYYSPDQLRVRLDRLKLRATQLAEQLQEAEGKRGELKHLRRQRYREVRRMVKEKVPWTEIGKKLGVTPQGARYIYERGNEHEEQNEVTA